jgi:hypothetical protein
MGQESFDPGLASLWHSGTGPSSSTISDLTSDSGSLWHIGKVPMSSTTSDLASESGTADSNLATSESGAAVSSGRHAVSMEMDDTGGISAGASGGGRSGGGSHLRELVFWYEQMRAAKEEGAAVSSGQHSGSMSSASAFVDRRLAEDAVQQELAAAESHTDDDSGHIDQSSGERVGNPVANEPQMMHASNTRGNFTDGLLMEDEEWHEMVVTGPNSDEDNWSGPSLLGGNGHKSWGGRASGGLATDDRAQAQRYRRRTVQSDASSFTASDTSSMLRALDEHPEQIRDRERACEEVFIPHLEEQGLGADLLAEVLGLTQQAAHLEAQRHRGSHRR